MPNCQNVKIKDVKCQKSNSWTEEKVHKKTKKELDTMRFTHNKVNSDVTYEGHQNGQKYFLWAF